MNYNFSIAKCNQSIKKKTNHDIILRTDWKPIKNSDYIINSAGQIMNKFGRIIKGSINPYGYNVIGLKIDGKQIMCQVHRLVAYYFVNNPDPEKFTVVNHKDENKTNNVAENLEWCTQSYNHDYGNALIKQALSHGKGFKAKKDNHVIISKRGTTLAKRLNAKTQLTNCIRFGYLCKGYKVTYATVEELAKLNGSEIIEYSE